MRSRLYCTLGLFVSLDNLFYSKKRRVQACGVSVVHGFYFSPPKCCVTWHDLEKRLSKLASRANHIFTFSLRRATSCFCFSLVCTDVQTWLENENKIIWGSGKIEGLPLRPVPVHFVCWQYLASSRLPLNPIGQVAPTLRWSCTVTSSHKKKWGVVKASFQHWIRLSLAPAARGPSLKRTSRTCL